MENGEPRHTIAMPSAASCLDRGGVCAYVARAAEFAADAARISRALSWMTPAERDRYARFRHDPDRQRHQRREQALERRMLDGVLTATLPVEGLRVGDILHLT